MRQIETKGMMEQFQAIRDLPSIYMRSDANPVVSLIFLS